MTRKTISSALASRSEGDVAERAYAIYLERGRVDGFDREDWLRAERELGRAPTLSAGTGSSGSANPAKAQQL